MGMREVESAILSELREVAQRPRLRLKDMLEWSTSEDVVRRGAREGETVHHCPRNGVWCCIAVTATKGTNK